MSDGESHFPSPILNNVNYCKSVMDEGKDVAFQFPDCWDDDVRMNSLFAPFKPRNVNPNNYESKMNFWISLIEQWCLHHKTVVIDLSALGNQFKRKNKTPSCLPEVITHLQKNKILISKESFYQMLEQSWTKWAVDVLVINPIRWTVNTVKNTILRSNGCSNVLLHRIVIEKLGEQIVQCIPAEERGKLLNAEDVQIMSGMNNMEFLEIVLQYLCSQKLVAVYQYESMLLVKFAKGSTKPMITDIDKALFSLEQNKKLLEKKVERLEGKRLQFIEEAKKHVKAKKMNMAKTSLKRSKTVEKVIQKISIGLENIESLMCQMEMTEMNSVIMDSYQTGIQTLKNFFKESGLTKEKVEDTRQELEDILMYKTDIDDTIYESFDGQITDVSDDALEEELKALLGDNKTDVDSFLAKLPDVPTDHQNDKISNELGKKLASLAL